LRKPHPEAEAALFALHFLAESFKLRMDVMHKWLPKLVELVFVLGKVIRPEWADHWLRIRVECMDGWTDPKRAGEYLIPIPPSFLIQFLNDANAHCPLMLTDHHVPIHLRLQPPDIYLYLFSRLLEPSGPARFPTLQQVAPSLGIEPAMQWGEKDPMGEVWKILKVMECFWNVPSASAQSTTNANAPNASLNTPNSSANASANANATNAPAAPPPNTARTRAESAMHLLTSLNLTSSDLSNLPPGIAQPIREALRTCQTLPQGEWTKEEYLLIGRPDMAQMVEGDREYVVSRESFRVVGGHVVSTPSFFPPYFG